jgi:hypothetical protein
VSAVSDSTRDSFSGDVVEAGDAGVLDTDRHDASISAQAYDECRVALTTVGAPVIVPSILWEPPR